MTYSELFRKRLLEAQGSQAMIAAYMNSKGYNVRIHPCALPDETSKQDGGDIEVILNLQLKVRNLHFTDKTNYPFKTVIIDEVYKIEQIRLPTLYGYLILNKNQTHGCFVCAKSFKNWRKTSKHDLKIQEVRQFYEIDVKHCDFIKIQN